MSRRDELAAPFDMDKVDVTDEQRAVVGRIIYPLPDRWLFAAMLGLDGAPLRPQAKKIKPDNRKRRRYGVSADPDLLPSGWQHDPYHRDHVEHLIAQHAAAGVTVLDSARTIGISSRSVQRIRARQENS